jgi:putative PIN family toxin of toxin-antitoxin system
MKLRVVVDSNVYISAFVFGGIPRTLLTAAELGAFELCLSPVIRREVERTLGEKFYWERERITIACKPLWALATIAEPKLIVRIADDPDDDRILECAAAVRAHAIVTGDDDLLRLKTRPALDAAAPNSLA